MTKRLRRGAGKITIPKVVKSVKSDEVQSLRPLTKNQQTYFEAIESAIITICTGPAGVGKSFIPCGLAVKLLRAGEVEKIIIARPLVFCGSDMGAFPGDVSEKVSPYMRPLMDAFEEFIPDKAELGAHLKKRTIEMLPLELMRGSSLKNAFILCDEAQNATYAQLHMFLTRFGKGAKVVITGDASQTDTDVRMGKKNPLLEVIQRFRPRCHKNVRIVELGREDIVRHPLIQWLDARLSSEPQGVSSDNLGSCYATPANKATPGCEATPSWVEDACPNCNKTICWNESDTKHEVEQVRCWHCLSVLEVPELEEPLYVADVKLNDCLKTWESPQNN